MLLQGLLDWARDRFYLTWRTTETVFCHTITRFFQHINSLFGATQQLPVKSCIVDRIAMKTVIQCTMEDFSILKIFQLIILLDTP